MKKANQYWRPDATVNRVTRNSWLDCRAFSPIPETDNDRYSLVSKLAGWLARWLAIHASRSFWHRWFPLEASDEKNRITVRGIKTHGEDNRFSPSDEMSISIDASNWMIARVKRYDSALVIECASCLHRGKKSRKRIRVQCLFISRPLVSRLSSRFSQVIVGYCNLLRCVGVVQLKLHNWCNWHNLYLSIIIFFLFRP